MWIFWKWDNFQAVSSFVALEFYDNENDVYYFNNYPGSQGDRGDRGPTGKGDKGSDGPQGDEGGIGFPGIKGEPGNPGDGGDVGFKGNTGVPGKIMIYNEYTVEPLLTDTSRKRTPLVRGHCFWVLANTLLYYYIYNLS